MVTKCRVSPPMSIQMLTRRTTQREYLMRPDHLLALNYYFILGYLQSRFAIEYHTACILSNHLHLLLTDILGDQIQGFNRELFSLMSRSTNCFRGRRENLWSSDKPSCVCVAPTAVDVVDKAAYIIVNAVEAGLVSHAKKWPGVRVLASDMGRLTLRIKRPPFFYDPDGDLPEEVELTFTVPKVWDADEEDLRHQIAEECNRRERAIRESFSNTGRKFMGAKRILRQSIRSAAVTPEAWFERIPHVACKDTSLRVKYLAWRRERQRRYDEKRIELLEGGVELRFPEGTYALHFYGAQDRDA